MPFPPLTRPAFVVCHGCSAHLWFGPCHLGSTQTRPAPGQGRQQGAELGPAGGVIRSSRGEDEIRQEGRIRSRMEAGVQDKASSNKQQDASNRQHATARQAGWAGGQGGAGGRAGFRQAGCSRQAVVGFMAYVRAGGQSPD